MAARHDPARPTRLRIPRWKLLAVAACLYPAIVAALVHDAAVRGWAASQGKLERQGPLAAWSIDQAALIERASRFAADPRTTLVYHNRRDPRWDWNLVIPGVGAFAQPGNEIDAKLHDPTNPDLDWNATLKWNSPGAFSEPYYIPEGYLVVTMWGSASDCRKALDQVSTFTRSHLRVAWTGMPIPDASGDFSGTPWSAPGQAIQACRTGSGSKSWDNFLIRLDLAARPNIQASQ